VTGVKLLLGGKQLAPTQFQESDISERCAVQTRMTFTLTDYPHSEEREA